MVTAHGTQYLLAISDQQPTDRQHGEMLAGPMAVPLTSQRQGDTQCVSR